MEDPLLDVKVQQRLAPSLMGSMQLDIGSLLRGRDEFHSAPLRTPPIATGMTDSLKELKRIIVTPGRKSKREYEKVPELLRRLRYLLRVYYDARMTGKKTAEFKYCDVEKLTDVGLRLHRIGLTLQLDPRRLRALFDDAPEMDKFLLDEPLDVGKWRQEAQDATDACKADPEADDDDRMAAMELEDNSGADLAAYHMSYFVGDVLVAWLLVDPVNEAEKRRTKRCMERIVEYSTEDIYRRALGDALTDAMRPIYWSQPVLVRFAQAGGLPALFGDWCNSMSAQNTCPDAIKSLPSEAWENQTEKSLMGICAALIQKIEHEGSNIVINPLFTRAIFEMYSHYGIAPFEKASHTSDWEVLFIYLYRRLSKQPDAYRTLKSIQHLLKRYTKVPRSTQRRHRWTALSISGKWDCITLYGCDYNGCPEKKELLKLREKRVRGVRDPIVEERLLKWGVEAKACGNCRQASYCSPACQKAEWPSHKATCKKYTAKERDQQEVDF
ncbi:hypothetical protein K474DRAFT_1665108 [Panus rudis PR-1116 ss-1]|nr:hypothetical protein K474DRAFT_1665108 [Panus rudis PR-1116 ss-1]